jgi:cleavage and polyadenylation specificity factor subunit 1
MDNLEKPFWTASAFAFLPPILTSTFIPRRGSPQENLMELLVADLGDSIATSPHLVVRTVRDDIILYQPFIQTRTLELKFKKVPLPSPLVTTEPDEESENHPRSPLRLLTNCGGYNAVFVPAENPLFILKSAKSSPKFLKLRGQGVFGMSGFHTGGCEHGFVYLDTQVCLST